MTRLEYFKNHNSIMAMVDGMSDEEIIHRMCPPPGYFKSNKRPTKNCKGVINCHKCWTTNMKGVVTHACTLSDKV